jgi:hypothetical protein
MALPITGSADLLELLAPFIPDDQINELLPRHRGRGRRREWSAAQLYRTLILLLLTPVRSCNLLCTLLPEQRAWRRFAHLPNRRLLPNARQLHEFRDRLTPMILRRINEGLLLGLLKDWPKDHPGVGLIDATDFPAATNAYKKRPRRILRPQSRAGRANKKDGIKPMVCRIQEAHVALVVAAVYGVGVARSLDDLGRAR